MVMLMSWQGHHTWASDNTTVDVRECLDGWIPWRNECFYLVTDSMSWYKGLAKCEELGATMITVDSPEKNQFVSGLRSEQWIDFHAAFSRESEVNASDTSLSREEFSMPNCWTSKSYKIWLLDS